jgi:hypothetical protein
MKFVQETTVQGTTMQATKLTVDFLNNYFLGNSSTRDCGIKRKKYFQQREFSGTNKDLFWFIIRCTTETTLEVRRAHEILCQCSEEVIVMNKPHPFACNKGSQSNLSIVISVRNITNQRGENCTFAFLNFDRDGRKKNPILFTLYVTSADFLPSTAPLVDPSSTTSPHIVASSTRSLAGKIRLVVLVIE